MAIQTINLTVPGGDTPRSANTKINANFTNTNHAASRLVGTNSGNVPVYDSRGISGLGYGGKEAENINYDDVSKPSGIYRTTDRASSYSPIDQWASIERKWFGVDNFSDFVWTRNPLLPSRMFMRAANPHTGEGLGSWLEFYTTANTTTDGNGYIKPSSPVLRVFNDHIDGNDDGERMAATYTKNGVGDYTITGTTGLRTDGWYITTPNDINGNPHVAVTLDDTDGVITLKTYVRIFDMTTFKFVPDLNQPLDIPDGRWIDLRFNDLPIDESEISEV